MGRQKDGIAAGVPRRRRGPSPQKTAETQARIVEAALDRFAVEGFERTRLLDVARDAGIAKGTIYLYFPTKAALFEGVVRSLLGGAVDRLSVTPPLADEPTHDFLMRAITPLFTDEQAARRQRLFGLILVEGPRFPEMVRAYRSVALDPVLAAARRIGARARERGETGSDVLERLPMLLLAPALLATIWNRLFPEDGLSPQEVMRQFVGLLVDQSGSSGRG